MKTKNTLKTVSILIPTLIALNSTAVWVTSEYAYDEPEWSAEADCAGYTFTDFCSDEQYGWYALKSGKKRNPVSGWNDGGNYGFGYSHTCSDWWDEEEWTEGTCQIDTGEAQRAYAHVNSTGY